METRFRPAKVRFFKNMPAWKRTVYVLGLPRSGKSTILSLIGSCNNVESVDEPFELQVLAQKGATHPPDSEIFREYIDSHLVAMENYYSELVLGRRYNLRRADKSCVLNIKTAVQVARAHARARRSDVLEFARNTDSVFAIAHNDLESAVDFVTSGAPEPQIIAVRRRVADIARDVAEKNWLSNEQLQSQANVSPAFGQVVPFENGPLFVPYLIPEDMVDIFLSLSVYERSLLYCHCQNRMLVAALGRTATPVHFLDFVELFSRPKEICGRLLEALKLTPSPRTRTILKMIEGATMQGRPEADHSISPVLRDFLHNPTDLIDHEKY